MEPGRVAQHESKTVTQDTALQRHGWRARPILSRPRIYPPTPPLSSCVWALSWDDGAEVMSLQAVYMGSIPIVASNR